MKVRLSSPVNAVLRHNVGAGTIVNDDAAPTVSIADLARAEGSRVGPTPFRMVVPLSSMSGADAKVSWSTANGSAIAPGDYAARSGTLTIKPGHTTGIIIVNVVGDTAPEPNETFSVVLGSATGATIADGVAQATILNDD